MPNFKEWINRVFNREPRTDDGDAIAVAPVPITVPSPDKTFSSFADDHNDFALALYKRLSQSSGNLFLSPLSVRVVCAMALEGARGETAAQMSAALRLSAEDDANQSGFAGLIRRLGAAHLMSEIDSANALFSQAGAPLEPEFSEKMTRLYDAYARTLDFGAHGIESARNDINKWVAQKTRGRIRDLVPSGGLSELTRLVLVNAIYFKGKWVFPFEEYLTRNEPFYLQDGTTRQVPLMYQREKFRYMETGGYQAVELDYLGNEVSMLVLLPRNRSLPEFEATLSVNTIRECNRALSLCDVKLFLPKFDFTWHDELSSHLSALGMPVPFTAGVADFSGINGYVPPHEESLHISQVFHQATVEVNEEGTEATAATALESAFFGVSAEPDPVYVFRADHPFVFLIREKKSGAIVFSGRVSNPAIQNSTSRIV